MKAKLKIQDMHCVSCSLKIDMDLEDLEGVNKSSTYYAKGETEIEFDPKKTSMEKIIETIAKTGYTAVKA